MTREFTTPPDPGRATTLDEVAEALRALKAWGGNPSYEVIAARVNAERPAAGQVGKTTVVDCFRAGRRRVDAELVVAVVEVLHPDPGYVGQWRQTLRVISGESQAAAQVRVLDHLPADLPTFTGRAAELDRLRTLAAECRAEGEAVVISALAGMAGVGKTQLAVHVGHQMHAAEPFELILFVNLRGYHPDPTQPPADPAAVLDGFLRLLGVTGQQVPHQLEGRTQVFREKLAGRRSLVVLDNAADGRQVAPLLPAVPGCVTLVTSRRDLSEVGPAARFSVDVFTPDEALQYLATEVPHIPLGSDPEAPTRIAQRCGQLPLALALVAGHMRAKPGWTLTDHADWLDERHDDRRLDSGVELALDVSYRNLPAGERALLRLLAHHPGADFDVRAAAALAGIGLVTTQARLDELVADHLVLAAQPGRYQLHDLVRAYAAGRSADEDRRADRRAAVTRLLDYYLGVAAAVMNRIEPSDAARRPVVPEPANGLPDLTDPMAWLESERHNLVAAATHATNDNYPGHAIRLSAVLFRYLLGRYHHDALLVHGNAARAARQAGDEIAYAGALTNLSSAEILLGRHEAATRQLEEALEILRSADRPTETARTLNNLAVAKTRMSRYEEAIEHSRESLARYEACGDQTGKTRALINMANLEIRLDRGAEAIVHYREALTMQREAGDVFGEAVTLSNLGGAEARLDQFDEAEEHLTRAVKLLRESHNANGEANALDSLGSLATRRGDGAAGAEYHRDALAIFRRLGDLDSQACAHNGLGEAALADGRPGEARAEHEQALVIAAEPEVDDVEEQARAHAGMAAAAEAEGSVDRADEHYRAAQELWQRIGSPRAAEMERRRVREGQ